MSRNRDLAAAFGVLAVAWPLYGFATGFMAHYYPPWVKLVVWAINVSVLIFLPLERSSARWTGLGAGIVGIIMATWAVTEIVILPPAATIGPAVNVIFGALFALFALRAYFEEPLSWALSMEPDPTWLATYPGRDRAP
jgi:hypothetical protein